MIIIQAVIRMISKKELGKTEVQDSFLAKLANSQ